MIHSHTCFQGLCAVLAGTALSHADEPAVSISDFGVDKVMSGPVVSINDQYKGVVKIEMDSLTPDYATPWNTGRYQGGIGTGFLIGENAFMTNAHVVSNAERIYISMYGDSRKIPARVKFIAHDADLALLEADDPRPFKGIRPFELQQKPASSGRRSKGDRLPHRRQQAFRHARRGLPHRFHHVRPPPQHGTPDHPGGRRH